MASVSGSENSTEIIDIDISNASGDVGASGVQPRRKSGRPKKAKNVEGSSVSQADGLEATEEEEEWDFFGELESHIENESRRGWTGVEEDHPGTPTAVEAEVVETATGKGNGELLCRF